MDKGLIREIYNRLGDEISKKIFVSRLLYSLTADKKYIFEMLRECPEASAFYDKINILMNASEGAVIFGAGSWGRELYQMLPEYHWKSFIDSNPKMSKLEGMPVVAYDEFIKYYHNESIVISSRLYYDSMYNQLMSNGIPKEKIINAGEILDGWSQKQYFDLEVLQPEEEEVFVDAGSLDGMSSVGFANWCSSSKRKFVYVFEPDSKNIAKCHSTLSQTNIPYQIVPKGLWNKEAVLRFSARGDGNSMIDSAGEEMIEVIDMDRELVEKKVTFIKMDIEGAELNALRGAKTVIEKNIPKMAICVYHKPEDIWEIPQIIMQCCSKYKFYLRHYSLTDSESVLYAVAER